MRRPNHLIEQIADLDNLYHAFVTARRGKQTKPEVLHFCKHFDQNIQQLRTSILIGDVSVGKYNMFEVYDPKKRTICAAAFDERVLHHAIINICNPFFERHLISDTYATRKGKGQYSAIAKSREAFRKYKYVLKLDFRKYFDSIPHDVLQDKLARLFKDRALLKIFSKIIGSYSVEQGRGLPIGNLTSQYFANYYLSDLDHYIKQTLRIKYYVRYMDDMLIFGDSFSHLREIFADLTRYITDLRLEFKPPIFTTSVRGVDFLGYKLFRHKILLDARSKHRFAKKLALYDQNYEENIWTEKEYQKHLIPLFAFARQAYSKQFRAATIQRFEDRRAPTTSCAAVVAVLPPPIAVSRVATTTTGTTTTTTHRGISVSVLSSAHSLLKI